MTMTTAPFLSFLLAYCFMVQCSSAFVLPKYAYISSVDGSNRAGVSNFVSTFRLSASRGDEESVANELIGTLEKRLKEGKGSLTDEEKDIALVSTDILLDHLEDVKAGVQPPKQAFSDQDLRAAVQNMDVDAVSNMLEAGLEMDEETTESAFWTVVNAVDAAEAQDLPLTGNMTRLLHHVFDADMKLLSAREKLTTNLTCMQPDDSQGIEGTARRMNYVFDDGDHKNLPLKEGRKCEGGTCCDKCSRNIFPTFALNHESDLEVFPDIASLTFNNLEKVSTSSIIQFVRLIERVRRSIAYEYGLPLKTILPLQAYSRKYVAGTTQQGGGGGEGDFVTLHTDEATHDGYHYSCVLYLSTQGKDFEGGNFVFNDPAEEKDEEENHNIKEYSDEVDDALLQALLNGELPDEPLDIFGDDVEDEDSVSLEDEIRRSGRELTPFSPTRGAAVIFSSGWENMHEVDRITSGTRYAVPCFFTTCPVPEIAYDQMKVGKPKSDDDIADDWLHLLLAHQQEEPIESVGRVKELLMKWHYICTPLSEH